MKNKEILKNIIKEEPVKFKENVANILKQKIAKQFKETVKG